MILRPRQQASIPSESKEAERTLVTRGQAKKHAPSQQTVMGQEEVQRRVVIHYSGSSSSTSEQCCSVNLRIRKCHTRLYPL